MPMPGGIGAGRRRLLLVAAMGIIGAAGRKAAAEVEPRLEARGWRELTFDDQRPNRFTLEEPDGVRVESRGTVSVLYRPARVDLDATPVLAWRWRVDAAPPPTDVTRKGGDDRALAVYVAFAFDPERAGTFERLKRATLSRLTGRELPGRVLTYIWGGDGSDRGWFDNPYLQGAGKMRVLRGPEAATGTWIEERVDLVAEHRAAFGYPPSPPTELSISADTDDTASRGAGVVADLGFRPAG